MRGEAAEVSSRRLLKSPENRLFGQTPIVAYISPRKTAVILSGLGPAGAKQGPSAWGRDR
ncbi:hypothetical protein SSP35_22_00280 [Streptomyces sp. NBRC 110611]|nr:hypothetical protein SSP35_22_00280 [Streptomyces sp. NBRC 110611]